MITSKQITIYTAACDNCGRAYQDEVYYPDSGSLKVVLDESGWFVGEYHVLGVYGKHYCSECWNWGDDDELELRKIEKI